MALAWQPSLLVAEGEPTVERIHLDGGAWLDHAPAWLAGSDDLLQALLDTAPWQQRQRPMYERILDEPRLTAWWKAGDAAVAAPPAVEEIRRTLSARYGVTFDSVGCNLYRHGQDSVAWHGDTVRKRLAEPIVAIVSLGQPRRFLLRPRGGGRSRRFDLGGGDLFVMGGTCQHTWEHSVPKVRAAGTRLSVTFRHSEPGATATAARARTSPAARGSPAGRGSVR